MSNISVHHSVLYLNNVEFYGSTSIWFSTPPLIDIWAIYTFLVIVNHAALNMCVHVFV